MGGRGSVAPPCFRWTRSFRSDALTISSEALCGLRTQYWLRRLVPQRQVFPVPADEYISFWCFKNLGTGIKGFDCLDEAAPIILKSQLLKSNHPRLGQEVP